MFLNYLKLALRYLMRDKLYSFINIGGLALGLAASGLLVMWVTEEVSYDSFHKNAKNIYHVNADVGTTMPWRRTVGPLAVHAKQEIPGVRDAVRISESWGTKVITIGTKTFTDDSHSAYIDENFLNVFDFPLLQGNASKPFPDLKSILLTESTAKRFFGSEDALGKTIHMNETEDYVVSGILKDFPANSSMRYGILYPFQLLAKNFQPNDYWKTIDTDWGDYFYETYVMLTPEANPDEVAKQLTSIHTKAQDEAGVTYLLQPLETLHLFAPDGSEDGNQTVRIFSIVAIAIMLIACINYVNLATARASRRAKEVGVRKTIGAGRGRLIAQFLTESGIIIILALSFSLLLMQLAMPLYNTMTDKKMVLNFTDKTFLTTTGVTLFVAWSLAGFYPALVLSSFQPLQVLRSKLTLSGGNSTFRKILVVTQFSLSIAIIAGTLIVGEQQEFIRNKNLGFSKDNTFTFSFRDKMYGDKETIRTELLKHPGIEAITMSNQNIMSVGTSTGDTDWEGKGKRDFVIHPVNIDYNFMEVLDMQLAEGKGFTGSIADSAHVILNETAVREMGITNPIGKRFSIWESPATIIGVVRDFHHTNLHAQIEPTLFYYYPNDQGIIYVKLNGKDTPGAIAAAEKIWKQYNPAHPFNYSFMDVRYEKMYRMEARTGQLFLTFSCITIILSCLGLFGLATYTAALRLKEVGIRKVMGADVNQIVILLSKDFMKLVALGLVLAVPAAWFAMENWLKDFAYKIDISWKTFVVAGVVAMGIALLTISVQTIRAAIANPVNSLRNE